MTRQHAHGANRSRIRSFALTAVGALLGASVLIPVSEPSHAATAGAHVHRETFTSPTGTNWIVPPGRTSVTLEVAGAKGGTSWWGSGGDGDKLTFDLPVTPGDTLTFYGTSEADGRNGGKGWVNGGKGGDKSGSGRVGAGGGAAAAVKLNGELVAVAGGGGGAGGPAWVQGHTVGGDDLPGGNGGNAGQSGSAGYARSGTHPGAGGAGAARAFGSGGGNASSAATFSEGAGGGGGGGGYASGNGGSSGKKYNGHGAGGGGGGGSSWTKPGLTPTIEPHDGHEGYVTVMWEAPVELSARVLNPTIQADAPVYLHVSATETGTAKEVYGEFTISEGGTRLKNWFGYQQIVELNLTPGTHTITVEHWEWGSATIRKTIEIDVPHPALQGGLGEAEPVSIDLDVDLADLPHDAPLILAGQLLGAHGGTPAGVTVRAGWGDTAVGGTTDADGRFTLTLPAPGTVGPHELHITTDATSLFAAAPLLELPVNAIGTPTTVELHVPVTSFAYGEPIDATVTVSAPTGVPSGLVVLADDEDLIGLAALDADGEASFTDIFVHPGTTALRALYAGDEHFDDSVSTSVPVVVTAAPTTTSLSASSLTGHAGDLTAIRVTVQAAAGSVLEPNGIVELLVDGDVFDTASVGSDVDTTARDGVIAFDFDTTELPAGDLALQARFVPGPGYEASESTTVPLTLDAHDVHLFVSPSSIEITEGETAVVAGHVEVLGHEDGGLVRVASSAPSPEGALVASIDGEEIGWAHIDPDTGSAELSLSSLPRGSGSLRIAFIPDTPALASAQQEIAYRVLAAPAPAPADSSLADTGASGDAPIVALGAAVIALLGTALLVLRRRAAMNPLQESIL